MVFCILKIWYSPGILPEKNGIIWYFTGLNLVFKRFSDLATLGGAASQNNSETLIRSRSQGHYDTTDTVLVKFVVLLQKVRDEIQIIFVIL